MAFFLVKHIETWGPFVGGSYRTVDGRDPAPPGMYKSL